MMELSKMNINGTYGIVSKNYGLVNVLIGLLDKLLAFLYFRAVLYHVQTSNT